MTNYCPEKLPEKVKRAFLGSQIFLASGIFLICYFLVPEKGHSCSWQNNKQRTLVVTDLKRRPAKHNFFFFPSEEAKQAEPRAADNKLWNRNNKSCFIAVFANLWNQWWEQNSFNGAISTTRESPRYSEARIWHSALSYLRF